MDSKPIEISADFMKDLRACDKIVVRTFGKEGNLELSQEHNNVETKRVIYEFTNNQLNEKEQSFWYLPFQQSNTVGALRYILKKGDILRIYTYKNGTQYLKAAGLNYDQLCISVERKNKMIIPRMVIASSLCPNNSARAIKPFV